MEEKWRLERFGSGKQELKVCSICKVAYEGYGNNARPVNEGRCCDRCNSEVVIPERIRRIKG